MAERSVADVAVVSLPFFTPTASCYPALLLESIAAGAGLQTTVEHSHIEFAGRFVTSDARFGFYRRLMREPYLATICLLPLLEAYDERRHRAGLERLADDIGAPPLAARDELAAAFDAHVDELADRVGDADVVGLTATHYQLVPSLLLAERLRRRIRPPGVVLGGYLGAPANADRLLARHPALDVVVYGEAEDAWLPAARLAAAGERAVVQGGASTYGHHPVRHSSALEAARSVPWIGRRFKVSLELSRGCYWDRCDFCNFNAAYEGRFKARPPSQALAEIDELVAGHGQRRFQFLDTALPRRFARHLVRHDVQRDIDLFCELRADFEGAELAALARLGHVRVQLGIESLVDGHLEVMAKGATVARNVAALEACADLGLPVTWGLMVGHPRETVEHLEQLLERARAWTHLPPPKYVTRCEVRPSSPLWEERRSLGVRFEFPWPVGGLVLPPVDEAVEFVPAREVVARADASRRQHLVCEIEAAVAEWQAAWGKVPVAAGVAS